MSEKKGGENLNTDQLILKKHELINNCIKKLDEVSKLFLQFEIRFSKGLPPVQINFDKDYITNMKGIVIDYKTDTDVDNKIKYRYYDKILNNWRNSSSTNKVSATNITHPHPL